MIWLISVKKQIFRGRRDGHARASKPPAEPQLFIYLFFIHFPELHINTIYNHNVNFKYKIAGGGAQKDI